MPGQSPKFEVYNGRTPHRPHVTPIAFNFTNGQTQLSQTFSLHDLGMEGAQSALLDNSASAYPTTFNFPQIGQSIQVAAQTQQIVPVFPTSGILTIIVQLQSAQSVEIDVNLFDCYLPPASWVAGVISSGGGGLVLSLVLLTSGTSWTVPANWNSANNFIHGYGAGGRGASGSGTSGGGGGGGGGYAEVDNSTFTPGAAIPYQIGAEGGTTGAGVGPTANTWFNAGTFLIAAGGATGTAGSGAGGVGGLGGAVGNCVGAGGTNGGGVGGNGTANHGGGGGGAGSAAGIGGAGLPGGGASGDGLAAPLTFGAAGLPGTADNGYGAGTGGVDSNVAIGGAGGLYGGGAGGGKGGLTAHGAPGAILIGWMHN
jgi:hypothetical protein